MATVINPATVSALFERTAVPDSIDPRSVRGAIVNHHLLAASAIAETLATVRGSGVKTVLVLSPNHFSAGRAGIITTAGDWLTTAGVLAADQRLVERLVGRGIAAVEDEPFRREHGIANVLPFVAQALPDARVVPLLFRDDLPPAAIDAAARAITRLLPARTLVLASLDFSHELPSDVAQFHDRTALAVIRSVDAARTPAVEIDSQPALRLLLRVMRLQQAARFHLIRATDSARVVEQPDLAQTTSYITGVFARGHPQPEKLATVLVEGLVDPAGAGQRSSQEQFDLFGSALRLEWGQDLTLAHVRPGAQISTQPIMRYLLGRNIRFFDPTRGSSSEIVTVGGMRVGLVRLAAPEAALEYSAERAVRRFRSKTDATIVDIRWRSLEADEALLREERVRIARALVDAGADAVIGNGESLGPVEVYRGRAIWYSLGPFYAPSTERASMHGLALGLTVEPKKITFRAFPTSVFEGRLALSVGAPRATLLADLADRSSLAAADDRALREGQLATIIR